jgi:hypothetical protein
MLYAKMPITELFVTENMKHIYIIKGKVK